MKDGLPIGIVITDENTAGNYFEDYLIRNNNHLFSELILIRIGNNPGKSFFEDEKIRIFQFDYPSLPGFNPKSTSNLNKFGIKIVDLMMIRGLFGSNLNYACFFYGPSLYYLAVAIKERINVTLITLYDNLNLIFKGLIEEKNNSQNFDLTERYRDESVIFNNSDHILLINEKLKIGVEKLFSLSPNKTVVWGYDEVYQNFPEPIPFYSELLRPFKKDKKTKVILINIEQPDAHITLKLLRTLSRFRGNYFLVCGGIPTSYLDILLSETLKFVGKIDREKMYNLGLAVDLVIYGNNETWLKNEQIAGLIKKGGILISDFDQSAEELEKSWSKSISTRSSIDDRTGEPNQIPILSASSEGVTKSMPSMNKSIEEDKKKLKNVILKFICS